MQNLGILRLFLKIPPLSPKICHGAGGRGGPRLFFWIGILPLSAHKCHSAGGRGGPQLFFFNWNHNIFVHAKFRKPMTTPSVILVTVALSRIIPKIVA